jgi:hypothetical protein
MSTCIARYTVSAQPENPDRLNYTPDRKWPSGGKRQYRVNFDSDHATIVFDEDGKPSELFLHMNAESRAKLQSRRQTPRSHALASDE